MRFRFHWLDGSTTEAEGKRFNDAFTAAGFGAGALPALDWSEKIDKPSAESQDVATGQCPACGASIEYEPQAAMDSLITERDVLRAEKKQIRLAYDNQRDQLRDASAERDKAIDLLKWAVVLTENKDDVKFVEACVLCDRDPAKPEEVKP